MRRLGMILIIVGLIVVLNSGYQIAVGKKEVANTLEEAIEVIKDEKKQLVTDDHIQLNPKIGEVIGVITIPKLGKSLPILEGTDEDQLKKGVGHYVQTKFPGQQGQIVLSGHRETVFKGLGELTENDKIILDVGYGEHSYEITSTYIVEATNESVIDFTIEEEIVVLTTCYPFQFIGDAPQRYIIEAKRK